LSIYLFLRLSMMVVVAFAGWELGLLVAQWVALNTASLASNYYRVITMLVGAVVGFVVAPYITVRPYRALHNHLRRIPSRTLIMGILGFVFGILIAALLALPLSMLPGVVGQIMPLVAAIFLGALGATLMVSRDRDILSAIGLLITRDVIKRKQNVILLDTSVIIDGRIADVCQTGFITGTLLVPRFILDELQHIADSADVLRRNRGRRGLDVLNKLQKQAGVLLEVCEMDAPRVAEVDGKLIKLAQDLDCPVLTNDYNLNRVAELQGVKVLNVNELANSVKSVVLPGEILSVHIIQEGKEVGQGVGYLDDGTMVVVEEGKRYMNSTRGIVVTRVLQTVAGRMIFGQVQDEKNGNSR